MKLVLGFRFDFYKEFNMRMKDWYKKENWSFRILGIFIFKEYNNRKCRFIIKLYFLLYFNLWSKIVMSKKFFCVFFN